ncbi:MAG: response regulator transcription factor [Bacteroidota bacterium]|nr:response regulator transcription factor [Bacteroidota bacterium]
MINIAIAEDQSLFRKGIVSLLSTVPDINVCFEAENGEDFLQQLAGYKQGIDVALIDINMPVLNGIDTMKKIRDLYPKIKNIVLTIHEEDKYIHALIEAGANAYLAKNTEFEEVLKAIHAVVNTDYYFNDQTVKAMHNYMQNKKSQKAALNGFDITKREKEVLELICREYTSQEISQKLFISESTVNGHRNNLLLKIGCKNTAGMVLFAIKNGLYVFQ